MGDRLAPTFFKRFMASAGVTSGSKVRVLRVRDRIPADLVATLKAATRSSLYRGPLQVAVFLIVFMAFDAAFSGDWSRIGAITKETEAALKPVCGAISAVHIASAGVAYAAVSRRGGDPRFPVAKALAVGFLAAVEAVWAEDDDGKSV